MTRPALALAALSLLAPLGCVSAPPIVVSDRATALEQQASGSFDELERKLEHAAVAPRPVPLTPDELDALGIKPMPLVDDKELTAADRIDALLRQHCIGEGRDGLLVDTHEACRGHGDLTGALELVDRANRARVKLWRWMQQERRDASADALRRAWQKAHARGVVCGGWIQRDDGAWEEKGC
jgi:hypothetical protein